MKKGSCEMEEIKKKSAINQMFYAISNIILE